MISLARTLCIFANAKQLGSALRWYLLKWMIQATKKLIHLFLFIKAYVISYNKKFLFSYLLITNVTAHLYHKSLSSFEEVSDLLLKSFSISERGSYISVAM